MKICKKCFIEKDINDFYKSRNECKKCHIKDRNEYIKKDKEKRKKYMKDYQKQNKEKWKKSNKKYFQSDKGKVVCCNLYNKRRSIKLKTENIKITNEQLNNLLKSQNYECNNCSCFLDFKIKRFVHLDHIKPLSKGGGHILENLQYLCQKCNLTKSNIWKN